MTNPADLPPQYAAVVPEASHENTKAQTFAAQLNDIVVVTPAHIEIASALLLDVKEKGKQITKRKEEITKPLNAALKAVRDLFRPAEQAYGEAEAIIKRKIATAQADIYEANRQAMLATQAALQQGQVRDAALLSSSIVSTEAPKGITFQERWVWRIVNAAILPRDFLMPDEKKIAAFVAQHGGQANIPGVVVEKDLGVIARPGARG